MTVIYLIRDLLPKKAIANLIEKVGESKIENGFAKVDEALTEVAELKTLMKTIYDELKLERDARVEIGVYDEVSQDLKDRL